MPFRAGRFHGDSRIISQNCFHMKILEHPAEHIISRYEGLRYFELSIRLVTGLLLLLDGMHFISHSVQLDDSLRLAMSVPMTEFIIITVGIIHLLGGTLIVLGLYTRIAIILQIPAILAEMYYTLPLYSYLGSWGMFASVFLLVLLVVLFFINSGRFSLDFYRRKRYQNIDDQME